MSIFFKLSPRPFLVLVRPCIYREAEITGSSGEHLNEFGEDLSLIRRMLRLDFVPRRPWGELCEFKIGTINELIQFTLRRTRKVAELFALQRKYFKLRSNAIRLPNSIGPKIGSWGIAETFVQWRFCYFLSSHIIQSCSPFAGKRVTIQLLREAYLFFVSV